MKPLLVVVDMQIDFISGALGTKEAEKIVPAVIQRIREFPGDVVYTRDTHGADYLSTQEGNAFTGSSTVSAGLRAGRFILMSYRLEYGKT